MRFVPQQTAQIEAPTAGQLRFAFRERQRGQTILPAYLSAESVFHRLKM
jgi:hypothetical protein